MKKYFNFKFLINMFIQIQLYREAITETDKYVYCMAKGDRHLRV